VEGRRRFDRRCKFNFKGGEGGYRIKTSNSPRPKEIAGRATRPIATRKAQCHHLYRTGGRQADRGKRLIILKVRLLRLTHKKEKKEDKRKKKATSNKFVDKEGRGYILL